VHEPEVKLEQLNTSEWTSGCQAGVLMASLSSGAMDDRDNEYCRRVGKD
jgi:hypothetical protein